MCVEIDWGDFDDAQNISKMDGKKCLFIKGTYTGSLDIETNISLLAEYEWFDKYPQEYLDKIEQGQERDHSQKVYNWYKIENDYGGIWDHSFNNSTTQCRNCLESDGSEGVKITDDCWKFVMGKDNANDFFEK